MIEEFRTHPDIAGIEDSSGNFDAVKQILALQSESFVVMQGKDDQVGMTARAGGTAVLTQFSNIAPRLVAAALAGEGAAEADLIALSQISTHGYWINALKHAIALTGHPVANAARPARTLTRDQKTAIEAIVNRARERGWLIDAPATANVG